MVVIAMLSCLAEQCIQQQVAPNEMAMVADAAAVVNFATKEYDWPSNYATQGSIQVTITVPPTAGNVEVSVDNPSS